MARYVNNEPRDSNGNRPSDYERWGVEGPTSQAHGIKDEEILEKMIPMEASEWWMEGNMLKAKTNHGILAQRIPTNYICTGTTSDGLPILKKIA